MTNVKAIFVSDIHLSEKAPQLRKDEPNWYDAMARGLRQLRALKRKYKCPVICAGDIFDHWNCSPELINFALEELPDMYAVPGQHDLPYHDYNQIERSAYWTLVTAGKIVNIAPTTTTSCQKTRAGDIVLTGFPFGFDVIPNNKRHKNYIEIAVIHKYCWLEGHNYQGADDSNHVKSYKLEGYDYAVFGDNHNGFINGNVINCGGFFRRTLADLERRPFICVLLKSGKLSRYYIDCSGDVYSKDTNAEKEVIQFDDLVKDLLDLSDSKALDIRSLVTRYCEKHAVRKSVRKAITNAMERAYEHKRNKEAY